MIDKSPPAAPSISASNEDQLLDLLDQWQEAHEQGRDIAVQDLCRHTPELAKEVERRVGVLRRMGKLAKATMVAGTGAEGATSHNSVDRTILEAAGSTTLQHLLKLLAPPQKSEELGRLGDYAVLGLLGEGGMGAVFSAEDTLLKRRIALKVMRPEVAAEPQARERFVREAQSAAKLQSDHIVPIYQVGRAGEILFIAMPLLQGESLDKRLARGPLAMSETVKIGRETALGLAVAHEQELVHRDVKPANIWLERVGGPDRETGRPRDKEKKDSGDASISLSPCLPVSLSSAFRVKILDFGLARPAIPAVNLTAAGACLGTPGYMSPEQINCLALDGRSDLFSLGAVLYRLVTGKPAFAGDTYMAVLLATAEETPRWPHEVRRGAPLALSQLIMKLLQKKPEGRYQSARELVSALDVLSMIVR